MLIYTKVIWDIETGVILAREGFDYSGPLDLLCGASHQQTDLANQQAAYYATMTQQAQQEFGQASSIFKQLSSQFSPILAAGPNQQGYSPAEIAQLNSEAATGTGETAAMAKQAVNQAVMSEGGPSALPSGAAVKANIGIATGAGQQLSQDELNTQLQSETIGRQNWLEAASVLGGSTGVFNPATGASSAAVGGGSAAMSAANSVNSANNAWVGDVMGVLGDASKIGAAALTGGAG